MILFSDPKVSLTFTFAVTYIQPVKKSHNHTGYVKPRKIRNLKKNSKMIIIIIINCHNGSRKPRKFSRSQMMKRTAPLNLSREI